MSPIFVAIDTPDLARAEQLAKAVSRAAGGIKLGLEFFAANGPAGVERVAGIGLPIFLDLKLHDIPNTVAKAVAALRPLEPAVLTVHAAGGLAMLEEAKAAAPEKTRVVGVTVLTSLDQRDLKATGVTGSPADQVRRLAALAQQAGLDGIVCSGEEVAMAHKEWPKGFFVVPGVRPEGSGAADQKRIVTPRSAMDSGASILVIGRPITEADDPAEAVRAIAAKL
jgi:orotidine-5'-phosphate decarboxylase